MFDGVGNAVSDGPSSGRKRFTGGTYRLKKKLFTEVYWLL